MPKRTRKMKQRAAMRRSVVETGQPEIQVDETTTEVKPMMSSRPILSSAVRPTTPATYDYSHIYGDLRRIAMFAGFFFLVLIVLSFVVK